LDSDGEAADTTTRKIREETIKCPVCGRPTLHITDYLYEAPYVGKLVITTAKCASCGYSFRDVRLFEARRPGKIVFRIEKPEDVNVLVVRSASASVLIPELGLTMTPGPASEGFITTVEGLLERFLEALRVACEDEQADQEKCRELREKIEAAKEGKTGFTIVIVDPEGVSAIASPRATRERVEPEELRKLGYVVAGGDAGQKELQRGT